MTATTAPCPSSRTTGRARHQSKAQRRQQRGSVVSVLLCLAVMAGGALAIDRWAEDTCPTPAGDRMPAVCATLAG